MTPMYINTITLFILFVPVLVLILLIVNLLLAVHKPDSEKVTAYECGFQPIYGQTRNPFAISFYVVAMLFLIFDLEILLIFPFASCIYSVQSYGFWIIILFFIILTVGFVYEFGSGALYFTDQRSNLVKLVLIILLLICQENFTFTELSKVLYSTHRQSLFTHMYS